MYINVKSHFRCIQENGKQREKRRGGSKLHPAGNRFQKDKKNHKKAVQVARHFRQDYKGQVLNHSVYQYYKIKLRINVDFPVDPSPINYHSLHLCLKHKRSSDPAGASPKPRRVWSEHFYGNVHPNPRCLPCNLARCTQFLAAS